MSSGALRDAWERANGGQGLPPAGSALRAAWDRAQQAPIDPTGIHAEYASGRLAGRMARENANDAERTADESEPGYLTKAAGGVASLARDIPGAEVLQAGARSLLRRQPYTEALSDIRGAEDAAPAAVTTLNRVAGAAPAFMAAPGSNMAKGAVLGALQGFTDADPEADRSQEVVTRGVTGGALGLVGDLAGAGGSKVLSMVKGQASKEAKVAQAIAQFFGKGTAEPSAPTVIPRRFVAPGDSPPSPARIMQSKVGSLPDPDPVIPRRFVAAGSPPPSPAQIVKSKIGAIPEPDPAAIPRRFIAARPGARPNLKVVPPSAAPTPTAAPAAPSTMDDALASLVGKLRAQQPGEIGNQIGDAELAMQAKAPPQSPLTLEELLRKSIEAKGGKPVVAESPRVDAEVYKGHYPYDWRTEDPATAYRGDPITEFQSPSQHLGGGYAGFFTDKPDVANRFAGQNGAVFRGQVQMHKPFEIDMAGQPARVVQWPDMAAEADMTPQHEALLRALRSDEYDGVVLRNTADEGTVYIPKRADQVRPRISATHKP